MAKKKVVSSTSSKSAATGKRSAIAGGLAASPVKRATGPADTAKNGMSDDEIGRVAGEIWHLLSANGEQSLAAIKKSVDQPGDLVLAAVGWLAREGKLEFAPSGRSTTVSLR